MHAPHTWVENGETKFVISVNLTSWIVIYIYMCVC